MIPREGHIWKLATNKYTLLSQVFMHENMFIAAIMTHTLVHDHTKAEKYSVTPARDAPQCFFTQTPPTSLEPLLHPRRNDPQVVVNLARLGTKHQRDDAARS